MRHHPLGKGVIVRGSWSQLNYLVEITGDSVDGWWIQGRQICPRTKKVTDRSTGWFSRLGQRSGSEIEVLDPRRPEDHVIVVSERQPHGVGQMEFKLGGTTNE